MSFIIKDLSYIRTDKENLVFTPPFEYQPEIK